MGDQVFPVLDENLEKRAIYEGLAVLSNVTVAVAVRRRCGNVGTRVICGFPSSEGEQNRCGRRSIIPPSERHFHSSPRFIGHSGENVLLGGRRSGNSCISESRVECTFFQILVQSRFS
jgi:hypothetical protein